MARRFARACRQWGLDESREGLDCTLFRVPDAAHAGTAPGQLALF
jgi:hypothetical protein